MAKSTSAPKLEDLIGRLELAHQKLMQSGRKALRKRFPTANELVYDYGRSIVLAYGHNERGSDAIVALTADAKGVRLVFTQGVNLPDPEKILLGKATQVRHIQLETGKEFALPAVVKLLAAAEAMAPKAVAGQTKGKQVLKESGRKGKK